MIFKTGKRYSKTYGFEIPLIFCLIVGHIFNNVFNPTVQYGEFAKSYRAKKVISVLRVLCVAQFFMRRGQSIVSSSDDAKFIRKVTIVNFLLRGISAKLVADACGETDRTLSNWVMTVDEHGFEALRPRKQPGRPRYLTKQQKEDIKVAVASAFGRSSFFAP